MTPTTVRLRRSLTDSMTSFSEVEVASLAAQRRKVETKKKHVLLEDLSAMGALNSSVHFLDASCAVGLCR